MMIHKDIALEKLFQGMNLSNMIATMFDKRSVR